MSMAHDAIVDRAIEHAQGNGAVFSVEEEWYLREYAESRSRLESLYATGKARPGQSIEAQQEALAWAGGVLRKAERLGTSSVASAIGADMVYGFSALKQIIDTQEPGPAWANVRLKAIQLLLRAHGVTDRQQIHRQVALVFDSARPRPGTEVPSTLPFTMPSTDYAVFSESISEENQ